MRKKRGRPTGVLCAGNWGEWLDGGQLAANLGSSYSALLVVAAIPAFFEPVHEGALRLGGSIFGVNC